MRKLLKNEEKYFQRQFWNIQHTQNILKITRNERRDQTHLLRIYFFVFFLNAIALKIYAEYSYYTILPYFRTH